MSLWQIAQAAVRIMTSPGPGSASSTVSIVKGAPKARQTAALVFMWEIRSKRQLARRLVPRAKRKCKRSLTVDGNNFWGAQPAAGLRRGTFIALRRRLKGEGALLSALEHFQAFRRQNLSLAQIEPGGAESTPNPSWPEPSASRKRASGPSASGATRPSGLEP